MILRPRDNRDELPWWETGNLSAIEPPPGVTSNFVNPASKASWDIVTQAVCLTVATLLVAMRIYTKVKVLRSPGWEDCEFPVLSRAIESKLTTPEIHHFSHG